MYIFRKQFVLYLVIIIHLIMYNYDQCLMYGLMQRWKISPSGTVVPQAHEHALIVIFLIIPQLYERHSNHFRFFPVILLRL